MFYEKSIASGGGGGMARAGKFYSKRSCNRHISNKDPGACPEMISELARFIWELEAGT
jgi:hypothetical protein